MEIFSRGAFYFGIDDDSFNDVSLHLGKFRVEYNNNPPSKHCPNCEPLKKTGDRPPDS